MNQDQISILLRALDFFEGSDQISIETSHKCAAIEEELHKLKTLLEDNLRDVERVPELTQIEMLELKIKEFESEDAKVHLELDRVLPLFEAMKARLVELEAERQNIRAILTIVTLNPMHHRAKQIERVSRCLEILGKS